MTAGNILIYVALIGYVLFKKVQGQPLKTPGRLFALPVILIVLGFGDLTKGAGLKPIEVTVTVIGALISLALGALRGRADKLSARDGVAIVQWGTASLALFFGNIAIKLVLDLIAGASGGSASAAGKSLIFTLGLTLLAEAAVLFIRSGGATNLISESQTTAAQPRSATTSRGDATSEVEPASATRTVADAIERHHSDHRDRHHDRHEARRQRHRDRL
jgi:hypothetical protein